MSYHVDKLRLEVEVPTGANKNLVPNPSGDLGPWGWVSPINGQFIGSTSNGLFLSVVNTGSQGRATTELIPVSAGQYVGGRIDTTNGTTAGYQIRLAFAFYDANRAYISSGPQTGYLSAQTNATYYIPTAQAPSNTAYVQPIFDLYSNASGGLPAANSIWGFKNVMVIKSATAGGIGDNRINLAPNSTFTSDTSDWSGYYNANSADLYFDNTTGWNGTTSLKFASTENYGGVQSSPIAVTPGTVYTFSAYFRSATDTKQLPNLYLLRYNNGTYTGYSGGNQNNGNLSTSWTRLSLTETVPANTTHVRLYVGLPQASTTANMDAVLFEQGSTLNAYYPGTTSSANFPFAEPNGWQNIIGPTYSLELDTAPLEVGTLNATLLSSSLDPAINGLLKKGKKVRLVNAVSGQPVFTGRIGTPKTKYDKTKGGSLNDRGAVRITFDVLDNASVLANQKEPRGVDAILDLPFLLEGKATPWNINGSSVQRPTDPAVITLNPDASVLDQVSITRDSKRGYAWVDRYNVLQVRDRDQMNPTVVSARFTDAVTTTDLSYSNIDVSYNSDEIINTVNVKFLRFNTNTQSTEEIAYGPYINSDSVAENGPVAKEFTIQGAVESPGVVKSFADAILAANATPVVKVNSLTMPVTNAAEFEAATTLGLYSQVNVKYADRVSTDLRITGISHSITPDEWTVTYTFGVAGGAASPLNTPSPADANPINPRFGTVLAEMRGDSYQNNYPGGATAGQAFTVNATGVLQARVDASAYLPTGAGAGAIEVYIDGNYKGQVFHYFNQAAVHHVMLPLTFNMPITAGTHYLYLRRVFVASDANDFARFSGVILPN